MTLPVPAPDSACGSWPAAARRLFHVSGALVQRSAAGDQAGGDVAGAREQRKDVWNTALGHGAGCVIDFTGISQVWLREAVKR